MLDVCMVYSDVVGEQKSGSGLGSAVRVRGSTFRGCPPRGLGVSGFFNSLKAFGEF